jgi:hypothetical protein
MLLATAWADCTAFASRHRTPSTWPTRGKRLESVAHGVEDDLILARGVLPPGDVRRGNEDRRPRAGSSPGGTVPPPFG